MKNEIRFTLKSKQRPKLAQEIGNILGTAPHYERVPSCAYDKRPYKPRKPGAGRKPLKPSYDAAAILQEHRRRLCP